MESKFSFFKTTRTVSHKKGSWITSGSAMRRMIREKVSTLSKTKEADTPVITPIMTPAPAIAPAISNGINMFIIPLRIRVNNSSTVRSTPSIQLFSFKSCNQIVKQSPIHTYFNDGIINPLLNHHIKRYAKSQQHYGFTLIKL